MLVALLWALGIAGFLVNADNRSIAPVLPAIADYFHVRESTAGLLVTAYSIPYGLFQLFYGPLADRIGNIRTITLAVSLFTIGTIACGMVSSFEWLFILRVVTGMFAAGIIPIALAQIGDSFELAERPKAIAFFMSLSTSGQALGIVIGGMVAQLVSWKVLFILIGIAAVPTIFLLLKQRALHNADTEAAPIPLRDRYRLIFANRQAWIVYGMVFLEGATFFGGFTFLGVYGNSYLGLNYFWVGILTAGYSAAAFCGSFFITSLIRKIGQSRMPLFGAGCMTLGYAVVWLSPTAAALLAGLLVLGFGYSFCHSTLQTYATELLPQARATAMSLFAFSLFLGSGGGPVWIGAVYDRFGATGMLAATVIELFIFTLLCGVAFIRKREKSKYCN